MSFKVIDLPFAKNALEPHISATTVEFHYEKHHKGYATKLNAIAESDPKIASQSLEEVVKTATGGTFNLAAQVWNHDFYWKSMSPNGGGKPSGMLLEQIEKTWGDFDKFKEAFNKEAGSHFGSGWAWLVRLPNTNDLKIISTHDAGNAVRDGYVPLLTCDVWEHAYYLDYKNARPSYLQHWWEVVNWEFASSNLQ